MYQLLFSPQTKKDSKKVASGGLKPKLQEILIDNAGSMHSLPYNCLVPKSS